MPLVVQISFQKLSFLGNVVTSTTENNFFLRKKYTAGLTIMYLTMVSNLWPLLEHITEYLDKESESCKEVSHEN